jgi:hypothetical protein
VLHGYLLQLQTGIVFGVEVHIHGAPSELDVNDFGFLFGVEVNTQGTLIELEVHDCGILFGVEVNIHGALSELDVNDFGFLFGVGVNTQGRHEYLLELQLRTEFHSHLPRVHSECHGYLLMFVEQELPLPFRSI